MGLKSAAGGSWFPKAAVICILLALLLHLIGMGAPYWARTNPRRTMRDEHIGLWRYCAKPYGSSSSSCDDFINIITGDWLKAAQAFSILGLFALIGAVALTIVYAFVPDMEGEIKVLGATIATLATSVALLLLTIGIFIGRYDSYFLKKQPLSWESGSANLAWGFGVAAAGCACCCLSFAFMLAEAAFYTMFILICVSTFGGEYQEHFNNREYGIWYDVADLDWAFGVATAAGVLTCVAVGFMVAELLDALRDTV